MNLCMYVLPCADVIALAPSDADRICAWCMCVCMLSYYGARFSDWRDGKKEQFLFLLRSAFLLYSGEQCSGLAYRNRWKTKYPLITTCQRNHSHTLTTPTYTLRMHNLTNSGHLLMEETRTVGSNNKIDPHRIRQTHDDPTYIHTYIQKSIHVGRCFL